MTKKLFILMMGVLLIATLLAGCGGRPGNLREWVDANQDEWIALEAESAEEARQMSAMFGVDIASAFEVVGDHELVMNFTFSDPAFSVGTEIGDILSAALSDEIESDAAFYYEMAEGMRRSMRVDTLYYTLRYLDANGNVLAERTFAGH